MKISRNLITIMMAAMLLLSAPLMAFATSATAISFEKTSEMQAELGKTCRRTAIATPQGAPVTYSSSDTKVATVDSSGRVTPVSVGNATITAQSGNVKASYSVNIIAPHTLEERINGLKLTPHPRPDWEKTLKWYDFSRVEIINKNKDLSNYDKMKAVFIDIAQQTKGFNCTSHASVLGAAYEMLGFKVYGASGGVKTKDGKPSASSAGMGFVKAGYTAHSWIAVEIDGTSNITVHKETGTVNGIPFEYDASVIVCGDEDIDVGNATGLKGEILYFDVNLYSTHGMDFDLCFAVPPKNTTWYTAVGVGDYYG